jgi:hypothetical protein
MKWSLAVVALASLIQHAVSHPGSKWAQKAAEIRERAARPVDGPDDSSELLGDLVSPGPSTTVGKVSISSMMKLAANHLQCSRILLEFWSARLMLRV